MGRIEPQRVHEVAVAVRVEQRQSAKEDSPDGEQAGVRRQGAQLSWPGRCFHREVTEQECAAPLAHLRVSSLATAEVTKIKTSAQLSP